MTTPVTRKFEVSFTGTMIVEAESFDDAQGIAEERLEEFAFGYVSVDVERCEAHEAQLKERIGG